jgi:hypothetical protein
MSAADYLAERPWVAGYPGYTVPGAGRSGACIFLAIRAVYDSDSIMRENVSKVCRHLGIQDKSSALMKWNDTICPDKESAVRVLREVGV